jgi:hypothetical protein
MPQARIIDSYQCYEKRVRWGNQYGRGMTTKMFCKKLERRRR